MRLFKTILAALLMAFSLPLHAQDNEGLSDHGPLEIESYYQIKWGYKDEFVELYKRNHLPILKALEAKGIIEKIEIHYPIQHIPGPGAWDVRVRITFRDPNVGMLGSDHTEWVRVQRELYPDRETFIEEEKRRFTLMKEHWDVAVYQE
ncbi:MAG: hypothetical protein AAFZ11_02815 [Pseudomonadota bacterium]